MAGGPEGTGAEEPDQFANMPQVQIGQDPGPIRESFDQPVHNFDSAHNRAQQALSVTPQSMPTKVPARMRGRIYAGSSDVLNGISGMEHLSNSLATKKTTPNESPAILAQMRAGPYMHHSSQPERAIMEQLASGGVS
eukprot:CAMPEP_0170462194 /NCGR_PEP_ID=MMETSP0123-20130129/7789_1 /TAXON_ID=182087 /ORGANISM="Favella ehrenbergii, Strain Fehren 1" /LENGTH=136 /DNA_ID=CAMNT_0010727349 /DNA_START=738 /DNA_END=1148 /DNA_ORIENTATION=+